MVGECWVMLGSAGGAAECWGGIVGGMLGNAWGMLRNAGECWGVLGAGGMLGENARGMLGECWGILGNARECWGDASFLKFFYNACELVS